MARPLHKLSAATASAKPEGKYSDGGGLWLYKGRDGSAKWVLRYTLHGRRHEMGLGGFPDTPLKEARESADTWRGVVRQGKDAIKERERQRREAERNMHLLRDVATDAFESRKAELKGDGKAGRWFSPLELHVLPKLGGMPVAEIDQRDIRDTLAPIWHDKADTARKAMNRLGIVMRHATALGIEVDLQATEKARALLGKQRHTVTHIPSMPWQDVPIFYRSLSGGSLTELALRLLILTAGTRSKPIRFCHLDQIDGDVWTVPGHLMKNTKGREVDFRVPLSSEALKVIEQAKPFARDGFLFPGVRKGVISDMTLSNYMKRQGSPYRPHGFRASFRTWCDEAVGAKFEVAEAAIAHVTDSAVVRSYRRTDFLEQRRVLMERWSQHVGSRPTQVIKLAESR